METLLAKSEQFVFNLFNDSNNKYLFHNYNHTLQLVDFCDVLTAEEGFSEIELEQLKLAAYFHDVGYTVSPENHEELSTKICEDFLKKNEYPIDGIKKIKTLILATKIESEPKTLSEQIIKDADYGHFIRKNFLEYSDLLRRERSQIANTEISMSDWLEGNISFFNSHKFYSPYAKKNWQALKEQNLFKVLKEKDKINRKETNDEKPEKGIETAFRVALKNHMKLSDIADAKANILLSVNAIIISVALSVLVPKLDNPSNGYLIFPTVVLVSSSIVAIIFSILSTRPKVTEGTFTREDINKRKVNLLFFGNFHHVSLDDFKWGMNEMMNDKKYLYDSMITDLYFLGKVLYKKYYLLRITYNIFLFGLLISVSSFAYMLKTAV
ncbi:Pycsar system effector family protein [Flagellimonas sp. CMM7]|uniref:Pycsar system effector family protein n=1 Tax=Flagellimonas sp. CMM7 TaxID=2654676 RepID=UPI0013D1CFD5|nr:Pycsar system effector family protein [Flagellimonas sp. CMM7]UII78786.1 DUF5706 domain-containing protein [Flagellimonas sp. CMM7]